MLSTIIRLELGIFQAETRDINFPYMSVNPSISVEKDAECGLAWHEPLSDDSLLVESAAFKPPPATSNSKTRARRQFVTISFEILRMGSTYDTSWYSVGNLQRRAKDVGHGD